MVGAATRLPGGAEKVSSLGKDWHRFCLRCEHCSKTLTPGGHAEHDGKPFCHKPCYATLFGPKGVNIGGAGSYIYEKPSSEKPQVTGPIEVPVARTEERKASGPPKGPSKGGLDEGGRGEGTLSPGPQSRLPRTRGRAGWLHDPQPQPGPLHMLG
ncbi:CRIP2 [Cervus elaphus hippelaphus]|uniref:Cysteine-rich protein 2 n=1 Tax=Cervus elaphus hippelaphus TaxID=46360 RepID=A0A212CSJ2_CEREH|nr:CRIP2 [Cervus elaphus hippelaphus]